jgi:hypothetical protein
MGNGHGKINAKHQILTASPLALLPIDVASVAPLAHAQPHSKTSSMIDQNYGCFSQHLAAAKPPVLQSAPRAICVSAGVATTPTFALFIGNDLNASVQT